MEADSMNMSKMRIYYYLVLREHYYKLRAGAFALYERTCKEAVMSE